MYNKIDEERGGKGGDLNLGGGFAVSIILVCVLLFIVFMLRPEPVLETETMTIPAPVIVVEEKEDPIGRVWKCRFVLTCESVDWRYDDPEDVCKYEEKTVVSSENPAIYTAYGEHCEEIDPKG